MTPKKDSFEDGDEKSKTGKCTAKCCSDLDPKRT